MSWFVVRTNIKCEYKALREIRHAGFEAYLPEYKIERFNRKKRISVVSTLILFPRYLFVEARSVEDLGFIRGCNGVEDFLPGRPQEPMPVPADDVLGLRKAQADMQLDDTDEARRHRGETTRNTLAALRKRLRNKRVRVKEGVFAGFPGSIEKVESLAKLRVLIEILGRETPVELHPGDVEILASTREAA